MIFKKRIKAANLTFEKLESAKYFIKKVFHPYKLQLCVTYNMHLPLIETVMASVL